LAAPTGRRRAGTAPARRRQPRRGRGTPRKHWTHPIGAAARASTSRRPTHPWPARAVVTCRTRPDVSRHPPSAHPSPRTYPVSPRTRPASAPPSSVAGEPWPPHPFPLVQLPRARITPTS